ncbi:MAG: Sir2 family NAD-dependent protein deacetylase [Verrucomicrobiota bacterium]
MSAAEAKGIAGDTPASTPMRVLILTGAGVSAESGIPTFRGKDGYWRNFDPMKLATPEAFARDPKLVWEWYRERRESIRKAKPNAGHESIARLSHLAGEFLLVTQNVDDLHARGGLSKEKMVQIHGDIFVTRCSRCDCEHEDEKIPKCPDCGALMRPGVVWFGEQLDPRKIVIVEDFIAHGPCDFVIVAGTTATFGYIVDWALRAKGKNGGLIEVNPEETSLSQFATRVVREPAAIALPRIVHEISRTTGKANSLSCLQDRFRAQVAGNK